MNFSNLFNTSQITADILDANDVTIDGNLDLSEANIIGLPVDNVTVEFEGTPNKIRVKDGGITNVKINDVASNKITGTITNNVNNSSVITNSLSVNGNIGVTGTVDDIKVRKLASTGLISGGLLSIGTGGAGVASTFNLASGTGQIVDYSTDPIAITQIAWSDYNDVSLTYLNTNAITYIAIDENTSILQQTTDFNSTQYRNFIVIGVVVHSNLTTVNSVNQAQNIIYDIHGQYRDLVQSLGIFNVEGNVISPNGANIFLNKSNGKIFRFGGNYAGVDNNSAHIITLNSLSAPSFRTINRSGIADAPSQNVDVNNYDVDGVTTALSNNKFTIHRVFLFQSNLISIQRGQHEYSNLTDAKAAISTEVYITNPQLSNGILRGYLITKKGTTDLSNTSENFFLEAGKFGSSSFGGVAGVSTLQTSYNNSDSPQITTSTTKGALAIKRGTNLDTDTIFKIVNGSNVDVIQMTGEGKITAGTWNAGPVAVTGAYSGGSGDHTNVSNPQMKITATFGYPRTIHQSIDGTVCHVNNYTTNKNVYWGESTDIGTYFFRGRTFNIDSLNTDSLIATDNLKNLIPITSSSSPSFTGKVSCTLLDVIKNQTGVTTQINCINKSTSQSSRAQMILQVQSTAGTLNGIPSDPFITFNIDNAGSTIAKYNIGIDNDDGDKFKISYGTDNLLYDYLGTNDRLIIDTTGIVTVPGNLTAPTITSTSVSELRSGAILKFYDIVNTDLIGFINATLTDFRIVSNVSGRMMKTYVNNSDYLLSCDNGNTEHLVVNSTGSTFNGSITSSGGITTSSSNTGTQFLFVDNTSNTANAKSQIVTRVAGTSANDPYITFDVFNVGGWAVGLDNSDSDKFKISRGAPPTLGSGDALSIDTSSVVSLNNNFGTVGGYPFYGTRAWVLFNGQTRPAISGTYVRNSGSYIATITINNHGFKAGWALYFDFTSGTITDEIYLIDSVINVNTFTIVTYQSSATSGNVTTRGCTINQSGNVGWVSFWTTGNYSINFITPMPDTNYSIIVTGSFNDTVNPVRRDVYFGHPIRKYLGACFVWAGYGNFAYYNDQHMSVVINR